MLTTKYVPGAPNWVDLGVPDTDAAAAFYGAVFGWQFQSAGPDAGGYGMFTLGGKTVAAVGPLMREGASPSWTLYFHTPDADATADAVRRAGGAIRAEPFDVFIQGRMAQFSDPTGATFAVWQPGETIGLDAVTDPGTLAWTELHTTDPAAATSFYRSVFGWVTQDMPMEGFSYTVIQPAGGGEDSGQGGIIQLSPEMTAAGASSTHPGAALPSPRIPRSGSRTGAVSGRSLRNPSRPGPGRPGRTRGGACRGLAGALGG